MVNESWESRIKRSIYLGVELLDHIVILFFFFLRTARLFSKMAVPFYILTSNVRGFQVLRFLACVCVCAQAQLLSSVHSCIPWTVARQAPLSVGFSRQEHWSGLLFPSPGDLPDPGIKPALDWQVDSLPLSHLRSPIPCQYLTLSLSFFFNSHPSTCKVLSHCGFDLPFPNAWWWLSL